MELRFKWLGQAGFLVEAGPHKVLIDPYLSDSLAHKYKESLFDHRRQHPPPILAHEVVCDLIICTHRHTDHMDPETLGPLADANPASPILIPEAWYDHAVGLGLRPSQLAPLDTDVNSGLIDGLRITGVPAAHETLETDAAGLHHFMGAVVATQWGTFYHSGDSVPYDGLAGYLGACGPIDVALLPVNGRDGFRLRNGVPGNFFLDEALSLCDLVGIPALIGHHFGLFEFNTVDVDLLDRIAELSKFRCEWHRPELGQWLALVAGS